MKQAGPHAEGWKGYVIDHIQEKRRLLREGGFKEKNELED
jgi:hypothetical protein